MRAACLLSTEMLVGVGAMRDVWLGGGRRAAVSLPLMELNLSRTFALSFRDRMGRRRERAGVDCCSGLGLTAFMAHLV